MSNRLAYLAPGSSDEDVAAFVAFLKGEDEAPPDDSDEAKDDDKD